MPLTLASLYLLLRFEHLLLGCRWWWTLTLHLNLTGTMATRRGHHRQHLGLHRHQHLRLHQHLWMQTLLVNLVTKGLLKKGFGGRT